MATLILRRVFGVWCWVIAVAVVAQVYLAGLYVFGGSSIEAHIVVGSFLLFATLLGGIFALIARMPGRVAVTSWALFGLVVVQVALIEVGNAAGIPLLKALHPVNALAIFAVSGMLAWRSRGNIVASRREARAAPLAPAGDSAATAL